MCRECRERFPRHWLQRKPSVSDPDMHHGTCATHVPWCMSGSLNARRWGKRSRHSRRMRNPQFYVSGKRPMSKCRHGYLWWEVMWPSQCSEGVGDAEGNQKQDGGEQKNIRRRIHYFVDFAPRTDQVPSELEYNSIWQTLQWHHMGVNTF